MLRRLPYRVQIPLGLSLAVLLAAVLVTAITARVQAQNARRDTLSLLDRAVVLVIAQVRPLLAADDTWRASCKLRDAVWTAAVADCACPNADNLTRVLSASCASRSAGRRNAADTLSPWTPERVVTLPAEKPVAETAINGMWSKRMQYTSV